jgi:hypothetical protein
MVCAYIVDLTDAFCFFMTAGGSTGSECYWQFAVCVLRMQYLFLVCAGFVGKNDMCLHC